MRFKFICIAFILALIAIDQHVKSVLSAQIALHHSVRVWPFLNFTLLHNTGAAFSMLGDASGWQKWLFGCLAVVVSLSLFVWLMRLRREQKFTALALCLIIGGAIGNLIDRIMHGYVIDFIDFHIGDWHYAVFNFADSFITIGVVILLIILFFNKE